MCRNIGLASASGINVSTVKWLDLFPWNPVGVADTVWKNIAKTAIQRKSKSTLRKRYARVAEGRYQEPGAGSASQLLHHGLGHHLNQNAIRHDRKEGQAGP